MAKAKSTFLTMRVNVTINKAYPKVRKNYQTGNLEVDNFSRITLGGDVEYNIEDDGNCLEQLSKHAHNQLVILEGEYDNILQECKAEQQKYIKPQTLG